MREFIEVSLIYTYFFWSEFDTGLLLDFIISCVWTRQSYVALSRAKSLEELRILDISKTSIRTNKEVLKFSKRYENKRI